MSFGKSGNFNSVMAILFMVFALVIFLIIPYQIEHPFVIVGMAQTELSPELFPRIVAVALFLLGAWYLFLSPGIKQSNDLAKLNREAITNVCATLSFMAVYVILMTQIGFVIGSFIMVFAMSTYFGNRTWWLGFLVSLIVPMGVYYLFVGILHTELPPFPIDIPFLTAHSLI